MNPIIIPIVLPYYDDEKENILKEANRNSYCSGTKNYDKKLKYLEEEKKRIINAYEANDEAIQKLKSGAYIDKMSKNQVSAIKKGIFEMITTLGGATVTYLTWQQYMAGNFDLNQLKDYLLFGAGGVILPALSIVCGALCVSNYIDYFKYDNAINSCQRRLK